MKFLPDKVIDPEDPSSNLCVLTFDEMKLEEGVSYDTGLKRCLGLVTPSLAHDENEQDKLSTHVLAIVLKGLRGAIGNRLFRTLSRRRQRSHTFYGNTLNL